MVTTYEITAEPYVDPKLLLKDDEASSKLASERRKKMTPREMVLGSLKIFAVGPLSERLCKVRDAYAYYCAECLAEGLVDSARNYALVFQYCNRLLSTLQKRQVLEGYGYFAEGSKVCVKHAQDLDGYCIYCDEFVGKGGDGDV